MFATATIIRTMLWIAVTSSTPLREAVENGNIDRVKEVLERGDDPNEKYENNYTPIYFAEKPEIVELLIAHGARINAQATVFGETPLEHAAGRCFSARGSQKRKWNKIVQLLKAAGADYTATTAVLMKDIKYFENRLQMDDTWAKRRSPLRLAARTGNFEICKLLLEHQADPDEFDRGLGFPIVHDAINHPEILKLLIEHNANLRRRITWRGGRTGYWIVMDEATALHFAVFEGNLESVKLLVEAGLDVNATDVEGQTPLHIALRGAEWAEQMKKDTKSFPKIVDYLLKNDASLNFEDKQGRTPLTMPDVSPELRQLLLDRKVALEGKCNESLPEKEEFEWNNGKPNENEVE